MSASLDRDLAATIERGAESVARRYGKRTPVNFSKGRGTVEAVNADGTLDVAYQGAVLQSVLSTTACANVEVGDSVLLEFFDARAYATGVVATADSSHYVTSPDEPLRVWTGSYVLAANDTSSRLWTFEEFASHFGSYETGRTFIGVMNGDGDAIPQAHVEGATRINAGIYAVFDRSVSGLVRVDWLVVN